MTLTAMTNIANRPEQTEFEREATKSVTPSLHKQDDFEFDGEFGGSFVANDTNEGRSQPNHGLNDNNTGLHLSNKASYSSQVSNSVREPVKTEGLPTSFRQVNGSSLSEVGRQFSSGSDASSIAEQPEAKPYLDREPQKARKRQSRTSKTSVPPGIRKLPSPPTTLEQAQMEWDLVETVQPGSGVSAIRSPTVTFKEALRHFQTATYLEQHMSHIKPTIRRRGCAAVSHTLFGPPKMDSSLHTERNLIFALALCMFLNEEPVQLTILQTIYKKLTGTKLDCPRYGNHWELIGFQGLDPATDLRGCGLLGLFNLLYLVTSEHTHTLALDIYKLSQHETQNFPFCVMSINITRIALQALREGKINKNCNNRRQVIATFSEFYVAVFYHVYHIWKHQHKTITDSGFVLKEAEKFVMKKTRETIRQLEQTLKDRKNLIIPEEDVSPKNRQVPMMEKFAGVCDLEVNEEEEVHLV